MIDLRFPTALQVVLSLANAEATETRCTSVDLAMALGANPSLVRKLLVPLNREGITASTLGKHGGVRLGRPAEQITLYDIYHAITENKKLLVARPDVPKMCIVSGNIARFFGDLASDVEDGVRHVLTGRTVAQTLAEMRRMETEQLKTPRGKARQLAKRSSSAAAAARKR